MWIWKKRQSLREYRIQSDDPYLLGFQLGRQTKERVQEVVRAISVRAVFQRLKEDRWASRETQFLRENYPELFRALRGLADGAEVHEKNIVLLNFYEDLIWDGAEHCSLIVKKTGGQTLLGWNEDGNDFNLGRLSLVEGSWGEFKFIGLNYPGLFCGDSLTVTSNQMVFALQSLSPVIDPLYTPVALPRGLAGWLFIQCASIKEVVELGRKLIKNRQLMHGFHLFAYDIKKEEGLTLEFHPSYVQPLCHAVDLSKAFIHTNHYIHLPLSEYHASKIQKVSSNSRARFGYLESFRKIPLTAEKVADILSEKRSLGVMGKDCMCRREPIATLHGQVLAISRYEAPILYTSTRMPDEDDFEKWSKKKIRFARASP
ncbi:MAG: C45 family peptidase [bacterium]|nr:C45 family peptidase [bacterium]